VRIRVLIADDHSLARKGLRVILGVDDDLEVVGEARDGREAVRLAMELAPDVVLMDIRMPGLDGLGAIQALRAAAPETRVVVLTSLEDEAAVKAALRAGASGYLLKDAEDDDIRRALHGAAAGQVQLSPGVAGHLVGEPGSTREALTPRESEVLRLIALGRANKEIARELGIGDRTVKAHVGSVLAKLQLQSRTQAALFAVREGLVAPGEA
jgi:DNA-binding NarL/FixJ family response regulator